MRRTHVSTDRFEHKIYANGNIGEINVNPGSIISQEKSPKFPILTVVQKFEQMVNYDGLIEMSLEYQSKNSFTKENEGMFLAISMPTNSINIRVIFPPERPPKSYNTSVAIIEGVGILKTTPLTLPVKKIEQLEGRIELLCRILDPMLGSRIILEWFW